MRNRLKGAEQGLREGGWAVLGGRAVKRAGDRAGGALGQQMSALMGTPGSPHTLWAALWIREEKPYAEGFQFEVARSYF